MTKNEYVQMRIYIKLISDSLACCFFPLPGEGGNEQNTKCPVIVKWSCGWLLFRGMIKMKEENVHWKNTSHLKDHLMQIEHDWALL